MGLGGYLACITERDRYKAEESREREEVAEKPDEEKQEIYDIMAKYGVSREAATPLVDHLAANEEMWIQVSLYLEHRVPANNDSVHDGLRASA